MTTSNLHSEFSAIKLASGQEFLVATNPDDKNDPVSESLRAGHFPLTRLLDLLLLTVQPGGRVIDLGAHVGSFSLAAAAAGYEVLSVEASPGNAQLIKASVERNGFANVQLMNLAISDREGSLQFYCRGPYGHLAANGEAGDVSVSATTLDKLLSTLGWDHVDFIKLDIEGSEVAAIRGMRDTLRGPRPPVLFAESNGHMLGAFGESPATLKRALADAGFSVYLVEPESLVRITERDVQGDTVVDYLACKSLPANLAGSVAPDVMSEAQGLTRLARTASSPVAEERAYAAKVVREFHKQWSGNSEAEAIRLRLCNDDTEIVRSIAMGVPPMTRVADVPKRKPWWRAG